MTEGGIMRGMVVFAMPLMLGNILQQFYNLADTFIVGRFIGAGALAAVGAAYARWSSSTPCSWACAWAAVRFSLSISVRGAWTG